MKVTKLTLGCAVAATALLLSCGKKEPDVAPVPDTEVQTAIDASWMTYVISDIDMMCAFLGENQLYEHFYIPIPDSIKGPQNGNVEPTRDLTDQRLSMNFYDCWSKDAIFRRGEVRLVYDPSDQINPNHNPNALYYHKFGFGGRLTLSDYRVKQIGDSLPWLLSMPAPGTIMNMLQDSAFDPLTEKMTWKIQAKFKFTNPADSTGKSDMTWEGIIYKTLENGNQPEVYNPSKSPAITWSLATCGYYGEVTGKIGSQTYSFKVDEKQKLIRDFTCAPDRVGGVKIGPDGKLEQRAEEHHPFVKGIASFTIGSAYPRQIYFGNESNSNLAWQCDNTGEVMIKGIAYKVNFSK